MVFVELRLNSLDLLSHMDAWRFRSARSSCASSLSKHDCGHRLLHLPASNDAVGRLRSLTT